MSCDAQAALLDAEAVPAHVKIRDATTAAVGHSCGQRFFAIYLWRGRVVWRETLQSDSAIVHFVPANQPAVCFADPVLWPKQVSCKAWSA